MEGLDWMVVRRNMGKGQSFYFNDYYYLVLLVQIYDLNKVELEQWLHVDCRVITDKLK